MDAGGAGAGGAPPPRGGGGGGGGDDCGGKHRRKWVVEVQPRAAAVLLWGPVHEAGHLHLDCVQSASLRRKWR